MTSTTDVSPIINDYLYHRSSIRIVQVPVEDFFKSAQAGTILVVRGLTERDYWEGIKLIQGKQYTVMLETEYEDKCQDDIGTMFHTDVYKTFNPLTKAYMVRVPLPY